MWYGQNFLTIKMKLCKLSLFSHTQSNLLVTISVCCYYIFVSVTFNEPFMSVCLPVCLSVSLSLSMYLCICLSIYPSIYLCCIYLDTYDWYQQQNKNSFSPLYNGILTCCYNNEIWPQLKIGRYFKRQIEPLMTRILDSVVKSIILWFHFWEIASWWVVWS